MKAERLRFMAQKCDEIGSNWHEGFHSNVERLSTWEDQGESKRANERKKKTTVEGDSVYTLE